MFSTSLPIVIEILKQNMYCHAAIKLYCAWFEKRFNFSLIY
jgi:hypothetical protein